MDLTVNQAVNSRGRANRSTGTESSENFWKIDEEKEEGNE